MSTHHAFPILNSQGMMIGLMPRNHIIVLLKNRGFYLIDKIIDSTAEPTTSMLKSIGKQSMADTEISDT